MIKLMILKLRKNSKDQQKVYYLCSKMLEACYMNMCDEAFNFS